MRRRLATAFSTLMLAGCGPEKLSQEELYDPATCKSCHPVHYDQWSGSMHAYASEDPVFRAMNARGQRMTNGELGDFCVQCHAPLAHALGKTTDGTDLDQVPSELLGINCYFCHNIEDVQGSSNNPITLAFDTIMRGGISDPAKSPHESAQDPFVDRSQPASSQACGSCHDIVNGHGVHLEQTLAEWEASVYGNGALGKPFNCSECHMPQSPGPVSVNSEPSVIHDHAMPGVDIALTPFPNQAEQRALVEEELASVVRSQLCVYNAGLGADVIITLENIAAGHSFPSGATQDRRAWVELVATKDGQEIFRSGHGDRARPYPADGWWFGSTMLDEAGLETHDFFLARSLQSQLLPAPTTLNADDFSSHRQRVFSLDEVPDTVELRLWIRPMQLEVLDQLRPDGLTDAIIDQMPLFEVQGAAKTWTMDEHLVGSCLPSDF